MEWLREKSKQSNLSDWLIALFTAVLSFVAILQFYQIGRQTRVMTADERARVVITFLMLDKDGRKQISISPLITIPVSITNTGKTPARSVIGRFNAEIVKNGEMPKFDLFTPFADEQPTLIMASIHPSEATTMVIGRSTPEKTVKEGESRNADLVPTTPSELSDLNNGVSWIAFFGQVEYHDEFGTYHWTKVCGWYAPSTKNPAFHSLPCVAYNDDDTN